MDDMKHPWRQASAVMVCSGCDQILMPGDRVQTADDGGGVWGECCGEWRPAMSARRIPQPGHAVPDRPSGHAHTAAHLTLPGRMAGQNSGTKNAPAEPAPDLRWAVAQLASAADVLTRAATRRADAEPLVTAVVIGVAAWLDDLARRTEALLRTAATGAERGSTPAPGSETYVALLVANAVLSTSNHSRS